ncbi:MAG: RDD family protein [Planctomycetota bacterium]
MSDSFDENPNPYQAPLTDSDQPLPTRPGGPVLARRLTRLAAAILDGIINMVVLLPIFFFSGFLDRSLEQTVTLTEEAIYGIVGAVIYLVIHGYLLATKGQTVGKMLLKIQVVDYQSSQVIPFGKMVGLRYLPIWIAGLIPFIGNVLVLVDVLAIFGQERRCVHDLLAGTKVVEC